MTNLKTIILAGGFGTRLSPLSTEAMPKQFHDLVGEGVSLFQQTVLRALKITAAKNIFPVANIMHKNIVLPQLAAINVEVARNVIFENKPRNTAYAIALAMTKIGDGVVAVMPSDHIIQGTFAKDIEVAVQMAKAGKIVTFGIKPDAPDSNFGYIWEGGFHEKPEPFVAKNLIEKGALWNSGIFVFDVAVIKCEFERLYGSDIENIPKISFDRAIMEKTDKTTVIKASFSLADLGNWEALKNYGVYREYKSA